MSTQAGTARTLLPARDLYGVASVAVDDDGLGSVAAGGNLVRVALQPAPGAGFGDAVALGPAAQTRRALSVDVAAAGRGALALTWQEGYGRITSALRDPGGTLGPAVQVSPADGLGVDGPSVAVDASGGVLVAWLGGGLDGGGRGRVYASHRPPGSAFGPPRALTRARATYAPQVAMNADGRAVITWRANRRREAVPVKDGRFGRPRIRGTSPQPWSADWPAVAAGPAGETVVTWREARGARGPLLAVRGPRGSVQTVRPFGMGRAGSPDAAFGPDGRLTIVWQEGRRSGTPVVRAATAGRRGTFGAPETVGPSGPASFATASVAPAVASGGHTTLAVWTLPSNGILPAHVHWSALRQP